KKAMQTQAKPPSSTPANGRPAKRKISSTSGGKARKKSTQAISGQRTQGLRTLASMASPSPPASPSGTTTADSRTVLPSPARMMRHAAPMISRLKKVCSTALALPRHARLQPAAEHHHGEKKNQVGDRGHRKRRRVVAVGHGGRGHAEDLA